MLRHRPYGMIGLLVVQLIVGTLNLVIGILVMSSYMLYFGSSGTTINRENLLEISVLSFVFGTLAFVVAGLSFLMIVSGRFDITEPEPPSVATIPIPTAPLYQLQPNYSPSGSLPMPVYQPEYPQPQFSTRGYVTQVRRTIQEQSMVSARVTCPACGREISEADSFCDACGAAVKRGFQTRMPQYSESDFART